MNQTWQCTQHTTKDARVHYPDLKQQPHTHPGPRITRDRHRPGPWNRSPRQLPSPHFQERGWRSDSSEPQQCAPTHQTGPGTGISRPQTRPDLHPAHPKANRTQRVRECR
jgi:hypothetical protein